MGCIGSDRGITLCKKYKKIDSGGYEMAKLYFRYSSMNSGKSTQLLQIAHNYEELGGSILIVKPALDTRDNDYIKSRIGLDRKVNFLLKEEDNVFKIIEKCKIKPDCILIDEAQFLTKEHVWQITDIVDMLGIPVIAFGLRTDFQGQLSEGSEWLLAWADEVEEVQTASVCHCGKKARFVLRVDGEGNIVKDGEQVLCGGNERYVSVCRKHFKEKKI